MSRKKPSTGRAVAGAEFAQVGLDVILVIGVEEVEELPGAVGRGDGGASVAQELPPLGMVRGGVFFPADRGVDRRADAVAVERGDLFAEQVAPPERGVLAARLRRVVTHAVVALGGEGDAVDVGVGERAGEGVGVELARHVGDERRGVKIQVDLPLVSLEKLLRERATCSRT